MRLSTDVIRNAARIFVGSVLLCAGIAFATSACLGMYLPLNASPAYKSGWIIGAIALPLIFGVVGFRMMTRRGLPPKSTAHEKVGAVQLVR
jgi:hypothetical protein